MDISTEPYETKFNLIDNSLVDRRNKVAHGEFLEIGGQDFGKLIDEIFKRNHFFTFNNLFLRN